MTDILKFISKKYGGTYEKGPLKTIYLHNGVHKSIIEFAQVPILNRTVKFISKSEIHAPSIPITIQVNLACSNKLTFRMYPRSWFAQLFLKQNGKNTMKRFKIKGNDKVKNLIYNDPFFADLMGTHQLSCFTRSNKNESRITNTDIIDVVDQEYANYLILQPWESIHNVNQLEDLAQIGIRIAQHIETNA